MKLIPLHISLERKNVLVVGGGAVALRKCSALLDGGAVLTVVAPAISDDLRAVSGGLNLIERDYREDDLNGMFMVVAATNDVAINRQIAENCKSRDILVSVADNPAAGDFIFPAVLRRGDLTVSVSTAGSCPGYAAFIRDVIAGSIGSRYGDILPQLAHEREKLLTDGKGRPYNNKILHQRINELLNHHT
jgi:precorrin-2 dehydrogenase/sirohydrochlorin ferrochelatase